MLLTKENQACFAKRSNAAMIRRPHGAARCVPACICLALLLFLTLAAGGQARAAGSLWGAGENQYGQLGLSGATDRTSPERVLSCAVTAATGGVFHSLFLKADGSLWAMGWNSAGQLGTGDTNYRYTPTQIPITGAQNMAGGYYHTLIIGPPEGSACSVLNSLLLGL